MVTKAVEDALRERESRQPHRSPPISQGSPTSGLESSSLWAPNRSPPGSDEESVSEDQTVGFNYAHVPTLVRAVKQALDLEDPAEPPPRQKKLFKQLNTEQPCFPYLAELGGIFLEEWGKVERRGSMASKVQKMYPFKKEEVKALESAPVVDAAIMRLVRYVTLPLEDTVSFKDPLDRRMEADLKRIYLSSGLAAKPALALATISKSLENWAECLDLALVGASEDAVNNSPVQEIRMASAFLGEASLDIIRLLARVMLLSVTARRALWLRPWKADSASKQAWCKIPFSGDSLFGEKLNEAIARTTGGKSGLLPQNYRQQKRFSSYRKQSGDRSKEARAYRPGREFGRQWRSRGPPTQKAAKASPGPSKSF